MEVCIEDILGGIVGVSGVCGLVPTTFVQNPVRPLEMIPISKARKFIIDHEHRDHLVSIEQPVLIVATPLIDEIIRRYSIYGIKPEIIEHKDFEKTYQYSLQADGRHKRADTYCYRFKEEFAHIPESAEQRKILTEFGHFKYGTLCKTSRIDTLENPVKAEELPPNWLFADNKAFGKLSKKVIPKCVPSLIDGVILRSDMTLTSLEHAYIHRSNHIYTARQRRWK